MWIKLKFLWILWYCYVLRLSLYTWGTFLAYMCCRLSSRPRYSVFWKARHDRVAERKNGTLIDMVNITLINSGVPENLWGGALMISCYILNRIPFKNSDKTLYTIWKNRNPNLDHLKVWGCLVKIKIHENKRYKIARRL